MTRSGGIYPHKQATYDRIPHQRLRGGAAPLPQILRCEVLHHHGGDDDRLRSSGVAPDRFIAFFYTGLGASLLLAGLLFACNFAKAALAAKGTA